MTRNFVADTPDAWHRAKLAATPGDSISVPLAIPDIHGHLRYRVTLDGDLIGPERIPGPNAHLADEALIGDDQ